MLDNAVRALAHSKQGGKHCLQARAMGLSIDSQTACRIFRPDEGATRRCNIGIGPSERRKEPLIGTKEQELEGVIASLYPVSPPDPGETVHSP